MLVASWLTGRHAYPDKIILLVAASSSLVMILFCSFEDRPAHYRMSFNHGAFGLLMGMSLAFFIVQAKRCLSKVIILIMIKQITHKWEFSQEHFTRWLFLSSVSKLNWNSIMIWNKIMFTMLFLHGEFAWHYFVSCL